jgi:hypothetical protein
MNDIDRLFLSITELGPINRTIQTQSLDKTIKKLDIRINPHDSLSVHPNTTVHFSALSMNRDGQNSSSIQYQLYVNILSKFSLSLARATTDQGTSCRTRACARIPMRLVSTHEKQRNERQLTTAEEGRESRRFLASRLFVCVH